MRALLRGALALALALSLDNTFPYRDRLLPSPLKRRPERMNNYSARILERMRQMGW